MMNDEILKHYQKGSLLDKILLIISLILFVIGITLYAMSAVIPSNLIHPNDLHNSVNYIVVTLLVMRVISCIVILISCILVIIVRIKHVKYKQLSKLDSLIIILIYVFIFVLSILLFWLFTIDGMGYSIVFYFIIFPLYSLTAGILTANKSKNVLITLIIFFSISIMFHYHLTFGLAARTTFNLNLEYLLYGFIPYLIGVIIFDLGKKIRKKANN